MNFNTIVFWVILLIWVALLLLSLHKESVSNKEGVKVQDITFHALIIALIAVMGFVPEAGYISFVPGISFSLVHLPVLIGSYRKGWKGGLIYGIAFGITSWIQAMMNPVGFNALFVVPWVSVLSRAIFGFLAGLVFDLLRKNSKMYKNVFVIAGFSFVLTILHTVLVFADLFTFYPETMIAYFTSSSPAAEGVAFTFVAIIALGMLGEATLAAIINPLISKAMAKIGRK